MRVRSQRARSVAASATQKAYSSAVRQWAISAWSRALMAASSTLYLYMPPTVSTLGQR
jgi:hypothetical protein